MQLMFEEKHRLKVFEKMVLRKICVPVSEGRMKQNYGQLRKGNTETKTHQLSSKVNNTKLHNFQLLEQS
jgi:hypothetical protein